VSHRAAAGDRRRARGTIIAIGPGLCQTTPASLARRASEEAVPLMMPHAFPSLTRRASVGEASVTAPDNFALPSTSAPREMLMNQFGEMTGDVQSWVSTASASEIHCNVDEVANTPAAAEQPGCFRAVQA
jgi:hypothetical protein